MCATKADRAVTFTCYFQLDMISLQPIKALVTYSVMIWNIINNQFLIYKNRNLKNRVVLNSPRGFKMTSKQEHVVSLCCLMWSKLMCQFTGITGIYLNAQQEQTQRPWTETRHSFPFLSGMNVICILTTVPITKTTTYTNKINVMMMLLALRRPFINKCITKSSSQ